MTTRLGKSSSGTIEVTETDTPGVYIATNGSVWVVSDEVGEEFFVPYTGTAPAPAPAPEPAATTNDETLSDDDLDAMGLTSDPGSEED